MKTMIGRIIKNNITIFVLLFTNLNFRQNEREKTKEQLDSDKKASYVGVPSAVLYCHVCSKHMWDSEVC